MEADHLARLLAVRLTTIAPDGFRAVAIGTMLHYASRFGSAATDIGANFDALDDEPIAERVRSVCHRALDEFQDVVDEITTEPWPGTDGRVPPAHAEVRGSRVHMWYGSADAPVLECEPIELGNSYEQPGP
jgi:hypothetical protein